jgi:hypothetical protein
MVAMRSRGMCLLALRSIKRFLPFSAVFHHFNVWAFGVAQLSDSQQQPWLHKENFKGAGEKFEVPARKQRTHWNLRSFDVGPFNCRFIRIPGRVDDICKSVKKTHPLHIHKTIEFSLGVQEGYRVPELQNKQTLPVFLTFQTANITQHNKSVD